MFTVSITCFFRSQSLSCRLCSLLVSPASSGHNHSVADCVHYYLLLLVTVSFRLCSLSPISIGHIQLLTLFISLGHIQWLALFISLGHIQLLTLFISLGHIQLLTLFISLGHIQLLTLFISLGHIQLQIVLTITFFSRSHSVTDIGWLGVKYHVTYFFTIADCVQQSTASFVH